MFFPQSTTHGPVTRQLVHRPDRGLRSLVLAVVMALASVPTAVWAKAPNPGSAETSQTRPASPARVLTPTADERTAQQREYASREAMAASQEKFEGGASTIWIGGSTVVIVLLVVLIVLLI